MADRATAVGDDLHLDVAGIRQVLLDIHFGIAERAQRLRAAPPVRLLDLRDLRHHAHTPPAAPGHRLDHHRGTLGTGRKEGACLLHGNRAVTACNQRYPAIPGNRASPRLVPQQTERLRRRTDKRQPRGLDSGREFRIFAQESVAGMHGVASASPGNLHNPADIQISPRPPAGQCLHLVGAGNVRRRRVVIAMNRNGSQPQFRRGAGDTNGDFAPIGDEQFLHGRSGDIPRRSRPGLCNKCGSRRDHAAPEMRTAPDFSCMRVRNPARRDADAQGTLADRRERVGVRCGVATGRAQPEPKHRFGRWRRPATGCGAGCRTPNIAKQIPSARRASRRAGGPYHMPTRCQGNAGLQNTVPLQNARSVSRLFVFGCSYTHGIRLFSCA